MASAEGSRIWLTNPMTPSYAFPEWRRSSDGVFAIAITLLVLELSIPEGSDGHLLGAVLNLWPSYLAYIVSFATILVLIVIGWFLPLVAVIGYLVIAFILIFPLHLIRPQRSQPAVS
jgi:hypothetical protein